MRALWLLLYLVIVTVASSPAHANEHEHDIRTALLLTRALGYERSLKQRVGPTVTVGVVLDEGGGPSAERAERIYGYLSDLDDLRVRGLPVRVVPVEIVTEALLEEELRAQDIDVLFLAGVPDGMSLDAVFRATRATSTLTMSAERALVERGVSLGAAPDGSRIRLYVNLPACRREGVAFSAELLQLAKVFR